MLGPEDLVLCAGTLPAASFRARVAAAAAAGFAGVSVFSTDHRRARAEGLSDADLAAILADHGLSVAEVDPLLDWIPGAGLGASATEAGRAFFDFSPDDFCEIARALGARSLNAVALPATPQGRDALADAFGRLCDRAGEHGLLVHLEFLPWTEVRDLETALAIVEAAGRENGGVTVDAWQHFRSGRDVADLGRIPGARVHCVQLCDAPREPEPDPVEETMHRRLLPGEGDVPLVAWIRALDVAGVRAPIGVEVFSDALQALPAAEAAQRAGDALRGVLARARDA